ncbi:MAG TPA: protein translocase subunit SecD [Chloroflexia bacterium]|nr:protein translocase subunit SecD [Chloroflexia bacterium]
MRLTQNLPAMVAMIIVIALVTGFINFWPDASLKPFLDKSFPISEGLDLQGGSQIVLQARPQPGIDASVQQSNLSAARDVIEQRVSGSGVNEPQVQVLGNNRIIVELPGVKNPDDLIKTVRETGYLEWIDAGTDQIPTGQLVTTEIGGPTPDQIRAFQGTTSTTPLTATQSVTATTPVSPTAGFTTWSNGKVYKVVVSGAEIDGTKVTADVNSQNGTPEVQFTLKGDGPRKLQDFTQNNIGKYMPIVLDKKVLASPIIQGVIPNGIGQIDHMTSLSEAQNLAIELRYGALPVGLDVVSNRTIGPTLGAEGVQRSLVAGAVGLGLVMLFMLLFYRLPGLLADVALLLFASITFALFRALPVTLTLAGIAGFILSIGMAVDANVLIFARIKEELRSGKTLAAAVEAGFEHAWPSIRDSNMTTIIITIILYWFGSNFGASVIKGFAYTLLISVLVSLFTAVTITRTFLRLVVRARLAQNLWWFGIDQPQRPVAPPTEGGIQPVG